MKHVLSMFFAGVLVLMVLPGCGGGSSGDVATYSDPSEAINVRVNHEFIIALESNPTTGYTWEEESDDDVLELVDRVYEQAVTATEMVGVGGTEYFRYRALQEGETEITLVYGQHWDGGDRNTPLVFSVTVRSQSWQRGQ